MSGHRMDRASDDSEARGRRHGLTAAAVVTGLLASSLGLLVDPWPAKAVTGITSSGSIVYVNGSDIWLTSPDGVTQRRLTTTGATPAPDGTGDQRFGVPSQSDSGDVIVAVRNQGGSVTEGYLWVMDRQGQKIRTIKPPQFEYTTGTPCRPPWLTLPLGLNDAAVSPDGMKVAYEARVATKSSTCAEGATTAIWVVNIDGSNPVQIVRESDGSPLGLESPSWASNSQLIVGTPTESMYYVDLPSSSAKLWAGPSSATEYAQPDLQAGRLATVGFTVLWLWTTAGPPTLPTLRCTFPPAGGVFGAFGTPSWAPDGSALVWKDAAAGIRIMAVGDIATACPDSSQVLIPGGLEADWGPAPMDTPTSTSSTTTTSSTAPPTSTTSTVAPTTTTSIATAPSRLALSIKSILCLVLQRLRALPFIGAAVDALVARLGCSLGSAP